ncbi:MAG: T9SS type A sorting domain-containing protein, partial [Bacteroidota bacterium]
KQAFPMGYAEPHYILPETEIEYLVRFQNTGNAPATTVTIRDTLDANLDLETFHLRSNSHDVQATLDPETREVVFLFENIMLPDSTANEPESHGYVSYEVTPLEGLAPESSIENTAYIFFDNNPPIVTNTTWHTIYECVSGQALNLINGPLCEGEDLSLMGDLEYVEQYEWLINNNIEAEGASVVIQGLEEGTTWLQLNASNPLCTSTYIDTIEVASLPEVELDLINDQLIVNSDDYTYQWLLNGNPLEGVEGAEFNPQDEGEYVVIATNDAGCSFTSEPVLYSITNVSEFNQLGVTVYPVPTLKWLNIELDEVGTYQLEIRSLTGQLIQQESINGNTTQLDVSNWASGSYVLTVIGTKGTQNIRLLVR